MKNCRWWPFLLSLFFICNLFLISNNTKAKNKIRRIEFEQIKLRGTGCPRGTTSVVVSPDKDTISILFDRFEVEVPQYDGDNDNDEPTGEEPDRTTKNNSKVDHKICHIILSANLPMNYKVKGIDVQVDFRGYVYVDKGVKTAFRSTLIKRRGLGHVNHKKRILVKRKWQGRNIDRDWSISRLKSLKIKSKCARGGEKNIKFDFKNVIVAKISKRNSNKAIRGQLVLDTTDIVGKMKFSLKIKPCK